MNAPGKRGKTDRSGQWPEEKTSQDRVKKFLFVHELFRRYFQGEATGKGREVIESWDAEKEYGKCAGPVTWLEEGEPDTVWQSISRQLHFEGPCPENDGVSKQKKTRMGLLYRMRKYTSLTALAHFLSISLKRKKK